MFGRSRQSSETKFIQRGNLTEQLKSQQGAFSEIGFENLIENVNKIISIDSEGENKDSEDKNDANKADDNKKNEGNAEDKREKIVELVHAAADNAGEKIDDLIGNYNETNEKFFAYKDYHTASGNAMEKLIIVLQVLNNFISELGSVDFESGENFNNSFKTIYKKLNKSIKSAKIALKLIKKNDTAGGENKKILEEIIGGIETNSKKLYLTIESVNNTIAKEVKSDSNKNYNEESSSEIVLNNLEGIKRELVDLSEKSSSKELVEKSENIIKRLKKIESVMFKNLSDKNENKKIKFEFGMSPSMDVMLAYQAWINAFKRLIFTVKKKVYNNSEYEKNLSELLKDQYVKKLFKNEKRCYVTLKRYLKKLNKNARLFKFKKKLSLINTYIEPLTENLRTNHVEEPKPEVQNKEQPQEEPEVQNNEQPQEEPEAQNNEQPQDGAEVKEATRFVIDENKKLYGLRLKYKAPKLASDHRKAESFVKYFKQYKSEWEKTMDHKNPLEVQIWTDISNIAEIADYHYKCLKIPYLSFYADCLYFLTEFCQFLNGDTLCKIIPDADELRTAKDILGKFNNAMGDELSRIQSVCKSQIKHLCKLNKLDEVVFGKSTKASTKLNDAMRKSLKDKKEDEENA